MNEIMILRILGALIVKLVEKGVISSIEAKEILNADKCIDDAVFKLKK